MRHILPVLLLCGCASALPPPVYAPAPPTPTADLRGIDWLGPKPTLDDFDTYVGNFHKLAFWTEWNGRHPYVKKLSGTGVCAPEKYHAPIEATLRKLRIATGVSLHLGRCDIRVKDRPALLGCGGNRAGLIVVGYGTPTEDCLEEELSQLMGLYNDIPYRWTLWNDENTGFVRGLTWHDAVMLRVLYQQDLHQGMTEEAAMKIVPRLMRKVVLEIQ